MRASKTPGKALGAAIESLFHIADYTPEHTIERIVPDGLVSIVIELDGQRRHILDNDTHEVLQDCEGSWVSGVFANYISITPLPDTELIALRLFPGHGSALLNVPMSRLNDRVVDGTSIFGNAIEQHRRALLKLQGADEKLACLEAWLEGRWDESFAPPPSVTTALETLAGDPTQATLKSVHETVGVSSKHLADLFKRFVGPTPKVFQRLMRFSAALRRIQASQEVNWADVSVESGYFDQAHFIRDFCRFSGFTPARFLIRGDDRINFLPEDRKPSGR